NRTSSGCENTLRFDRDKLACVARRMRPQHIVTSVGLGPLAGRRRSRMPMMLRYMVAAFIMLVAAIFAISPFASTFVRQWSRRDVELRSVLVFNSVRNELANLLAVGATAQIDDLFGRLALDERLLAVGLCDREGSLRNRSKLMPADFSCEKVARTASASFSAIVSDERRLVAGSFPISTDRASGHLVLLHDLTFAEQRSSQVRTWITIALAAVALIGAA